MVEPVNKVGAQNNGGNANKTQRPAQITVKSGETVASLAKKFGMSVDDFRKWTGIEGGIKAGQKINLPTATVPQGKGIYAVAREAGMDFTEFCKLNNIPKDYSASSGEVFYVKKKSQASKPAQAKSTKTSASPKPKAAPKPQQTSTPKTAPVEPENEMQKALMEGARIGAIPFENMAKYGTPYSPRTIAEKLEEAAYNNRGAVGKKDFDDMMKNVNSKNVAEVLTEYENLKGKSLIHRITHETSSTKDARKNAVMQIYDTLAQVKGTPAEKRTEFQTELNNQFDSWGYVNTSKMDSWIKEMINSPDAAASNSTSAPAKNPVLTSNKSTSKAVVHLTNKSGDFTVSNLQSGAIASAKKEAKTNFQAYCKANGIKYDENLLDLTPLERIPAPTVKNGKIVGTESELLKPTTKPNGNVVIINPGHGGYSSRSGYFDPGSYSFIKKANGKYAPLLEYEKMKIYADSVVEKLRAKGYAVVLTNAHAQTMSDQGTISNIVKGLNNGTKGSKKYPNNNIMFISLHADSEPGKTGSGVCYDSSFSNDTRFANILKNNLNEDDWISASLSERNWNVPHKGLQVLHQTETIPSVLLEVEYVNGAKSKNLDSSSYQARFENKMIEGINEYFGIK
ncbi:N-acetylmuramoyl-L-alanine amidase [bacterium]|nr:N-acetylmuramoyl-L-alanine amidase [bacterium]